VLDEVDEPAIPRERLLAEVAGVVVDEIQRA
jgi:hypothetical protein